MPESIGAYTSPASTIAKTSKPFIRGIKFVPRGSAAAETASSSWSPPALTGKAFLIIDNKPKTLLKER